ncbi:MAG: transposase [Acidimicrobiales bacterium]|nr:transposase [Acidimicrobiales bacterium]
MRRREVGGGWHHVLNRGARRLPVFGDEADYRAFLRILGQSLAASDARAHAYALMPNHFHLVLEATVDQMATTMKSLAASYTRRFNARYGYDGALFRGRYRSKPIASERQLRETVRYVHRNPVGDGPLDPTRLRWTSHLAYTGVVSGPSWLKTATVLHRFADDVATFDAFVSSGTAEGHGPRLLDPVLNVSGIRRIEAALGVESDAEREVLRAGGRGVRNDVRLAALLLGHLRGVEDVGSLAERYGYRNIATARSAIARARARVDRDPGFRALVSDAAARLDQWRRESTGV